MRALSVDKVWVANEIAIMMLQHWKDAVEYMRGYGVLRPNRKSSAGVPVPTPTQKDHVLYPSSTEPIMTRDEEKSNFSTVNRATGGFFKNPA